MALIWADGFDHYNDSAALALTTYSAGGNARVDPSHPRTGGKSLYFPRGTAGNVLGLAFPPTNIVTAGAAFFTPANPGNDDTTIGFFISDDVGNGYRVGFDKDRRIIIGAGYGGAVLAATDPNTFTPNAYQYIEARFVKPNSIEVRLQNKQVLLATNAAFSASPFSYIKLCCTSGGPNFNQNLIADTWIDDFYVCDQNGALNNDFLGDIRCRTYLPSGDGPVQDWGHTGASAYSQINQLPIDAARFINSDAVGEVSNFVKDALPDNIAYVSGVAFHLAASKTDAGACEITPQIENAGSVGDGAPILPGVGVAIYTRTFDGDPNTGNTFTRQGFDSARFQVKRTA